MLMEIQIFVQRLRPITYYANFHQHKCPLNDHCEDIYVDGNSDICTETEAYYILCVIGVSWTVPTNLARGTLVKCASKSIIGRILSLYSKSM